MRFISLIIGLLVLHLSPATASVEIDALLQELDEKLRNQDTYVEAKKSKISQIRERLKAANGEPNATYTIQNELFAEYKVYRFDSALHYAYANIRLSDLLNNTNWKTEAMLNLSSILTAAGMYKESLEHLAGIDRNAIPPSLLKRYYLEYKRTYEGLQSYASVGDFGPGYGQQARSYQDSLLQVLDERSNDYLLEVGLTHLVERRLMQAKEIYLDLCQNKLQPASGLYAKATATLAGIYEQLDENVEQKRWLIRSTRSDIEAVIKENASLTNLAMQLYREGEIERANNYIEYALADANFYNARQRKLEISQIYPIINEAYLRQEQQQQDTLRFYLGFITAISILLIIALSAIYLQMKKLSRARKNLHNLNTELSKVNTRLHESNYKLNESNEKLKEANYIKEEYIGHFLNQCSVYIDKLESYQKVVRKKVMTKEHKALIKMTESKTFVESELKEFYSNFDRAFLRLYPNFVDEFNSLLGENQKIVPKKGELLTTELRIFALIRLGISDSYKIAHFLRYSVNTIYNYRAQIKNKSTVERDHFENHIMSIGSFYNDN
ncbi:MAG: hypothetical protein HRU41_08050 [Saprospiraceae bacterium]|nr:hypothetical protein [Saprospiraceae bacterium]